MAERRTEIITTVQVFENTYKGKTTRRKVAILDVYQHGERTHKASTNIETRIKKKQAKLMKNDGIRDIIIQGNFHGLTKFEGCTEMYRPVPTKPTLSPTKSRCYLHVFACLQKGQILDFAEYEYKFVPQGSLLGADNWRTVDGQNKN